MSPAEIKFELWQRLANLAQGGRMPVITSIHSIVVEGDEVFVNYDLLSDRSEDLLLFEYRRPQVVAADEVDAFTRWLAWSDLDATVH